MAVSIWDIVHVDEMGQIMPGEAGFFLPTKFRLVVFRPLVGEVLQVTVKEIDSHAIRCSVSFFEDIWLPISLARPGTV